LGAGTGEGTGSGAGTGLVFEHVKEFLF
jgi:hypothetical protein